PQEGMAMPGEDPDWGPLNYTFAGSWEIAPSWVEEHLQNVQVVDVRAPDEFDGPLGHIPGAVLVPLGQLAASTALLATDRPIVTGCRAGGRSAQATVLLRKAGFERIANLAGGMLRWRAEHHLTEGGKD